MAKSPSSTLEAPAASTSIGQATDVLARVAQAKREADESKPVNSTPIARAGLGRLGRVSGGNFALKRLVIAEANNVDVSVNPPTAIDPARCREMRVPLHMEPQTYYQPIKSGGSEFLLVAPTEVVVNEFEDEYASERVRDKALSAQPAYAVEDGAIVNQVALNLGPIDYGKLNAAGGGTWKGKAGLEERI